MGRERRSELADNDAEEWSNVRKYGEHTRRIGRIVGNPEDTTVVAAAEFFRAANVGGVMAGGAGCRRRHVVSGRW